MKTELESEEDFLKAMDGKTNNGGSTSTGCIKRSGWLDRLRVIPILNNEWYYAVPAMGIGAGIIIYF